MGTFQQAGQSGLAVPLLIALALLAANLPFVTHRIMGVMPVPHRWSGLGKAVKPVWMLVLELVALYFVVGGVGLWLEHRAGQIALQKWEFYAITATLFLTFSFPGFVWRFLIRRN